MGQANEPADIPVLMDGQKNKTLQTNRQFTKKLLCEGCEDRFNSGGESTVISQMYRTRDNFVLRDILRKKLPDEKSPYGPTYYPGSIEPEISSNQFAYFAISVLWRASVTKWDPLTDYYYKSLGKIYENNYSEYLLGNIEFPIKTYIAIIVDPENDPTTVATLPIVNRSENANATCHVHSFFIPGIKFVVFVGGKLQPDLKQLFATANSRILFFFSKFAGSPAYEQAVKDAKKNKIVGKLATKWGV